MIVVAPLPGQVDLVDRDPVGPHRGPHVGEGCREVVGVLERRARDDQVGLIAQNDGEMVSVSDSIFDQSVHTLENVFAGTRDDLRNDPHQEFVTVAT